MAVMYYTLFAGNNLIKLLSETLIAALAWFNSTIVTKRQVADITPSHGSVPPGGTAFSLSRLALG
jgi:hypothetical protein